jgi:hypothetical protein
MSACRCQRDISMDTLGWCMRCRPPPRGTSARILQDRPSCWLRSRHRPSGRRGVKHRQAGSPLHSMLTHNTQSCIQTNQARGMREDTGNGT